MTVGWLQPVCGDWFLGWWLHAAAGEWTVDTVDSGHTLTRDKSTSDQPDTFKYRDTLHPPHHVTNSDPADLDQLTSATELQNG